jgi:hypothetical protein
MPKNIAMPTEIPIVKPAARPTVSKPRWGNYLKDRKAYLHEAVALSMNVSPTEVARLVSDTTTPTGRRYSARLRAARLEMDGAITVLEEGREDDGSDWIIDLKSFVTFALSRDWGCSSEKFKRLGAESPTANVAEDTTKVLKTPRVFVAALIFLLVEIAKRATEREEAFDVNKMPGRREDLQELAQKFNKYPKCSKASFETYIKGLCKFLPGQKESNFYKNLFPEKFSTP